MFRTLTAVAALCALPSLADARTRVSVISPECNVTMPCIGASIGGQRQTRRPLKFQSPTTESVSTFAPPQMSAAGLVGPLQSKLASIEAACPGTQAISTVRHTRIAGTRVMSLHAQGKAVDVRGPYGCIYAQLQGWQGGYSTDAGRMQHIHISYDDTGGREMGLRFAHGGGRRNSWRDSYARMQ
ncbi:MAG: hypothetical protein HY242_07840 [Afipia sp.]|nr:hypothetical protein [Afipia sp.]